MWSHNWICLTAGSYVPNAGDTIPLDLAGVPLFAMRGRDGEIRVFHNACPHRGMKLVSERGNAGALLTCPYHNWAFGLGGELRQTPTSQAPANTNVKASISRSSASRKSPARSGSIRCL